MKQIILYYAGLVIILLTIYRLSGVNEAVYYVTIAAAAVFIFFVYLVWNTYEESRLDKIQAHELRMLQEESNQTRIDMRQESELDERYQSLIKRNDELYKKLNDLENDRDKGTEAK